MESRINNIIEGNKTGEKYANILRLIERQGTPHKTLKKFWDLYEKTSRSNSSNGKMFEFIVCECLIQFGAGPLYFQSQFYNLEQDTYDLASWTKDGFPIIISCKTSLRERWKQAELEGRLLKSKYPNAKSYLVTLHTEEAIRLRKGISDKKVTGIDEVYLGDRPEFDDFVESMREAGLRKVTPILPLKGKVFGPGS